MNEPAELIGKNYRIRQIAIEMIIDIYNDAGLLVDRSASSKLVIPEAKFPLELVAILTHSTNLGRGFSSFDTPPPPDVPK